VSKSYIPGETVLRIPDFDPRIARCGTRAPVSSPWIGVDARTTAILSDNPIFVGRKTDLARSLLQPDSPAGLARRTRRLIRKRR
jgi:hypothetical protein